MWLCRGPLQDVPTVLESVMGHTLLAVSELLSPASARSMSVVTVTASTDSQATSKAVSMQAGRMDSGLARADLCRYVDVSLIASSILACRGWRAQHGSMFLGQVLFALCRHGASRCCPCVSTAGERRRAPLTAHLHTTRGVLRRIQHAVQYASIDLPSCVGPPVHARRELGSNRSQRHEHRE